MGRIGPQTLRLAELARCMPFSRAHARPYFLAAWHAATDGTDVAKEISLVSPLEIAGFTAREPPAVYLSLSERMSPSEQDKIALGRASGFFLIDLASLVPPAILQYGNFDVLFTIQNRLPWMSSIWQKWGDYTQRNLLETLRAS